MKEKTHWMQSPNKNYLGHWDLPESGELVLTLESAGWEAVKNPVTNSSESKRVVRFKEKGIKPWICNQTNAQSIVRCTGIKFMEDCNGAVITLYVDSITDRRTKEDVDCIRVRPVNRYTVKILEDLLKNKRSKLDPQLISRTEEIIVNEETASYKKAITILQNI